MDKRIWLIGMVGVLLVLAGQGNAAAQGVSKKVGVLVWANEARYENGVTGFVEQLKNDGLGSPSVEIVMRRAGGSKVTAMKMAEELADQKLDLYYALGTGGTSAMYMATKSAPIVFSTVYDPVEAGLVQGWESSRNNVTGAASLVPMSRVLELAKQMMPIKNVAALYTPHEKNSESQVRALQACQAGLGVTIIPVAIVNEAEIATALPFVEGKVQAIYVTGSIVVGKGIADVVRFAAEKKIMTVTHLEDLVEKGIMVGYCADSKEQGVLAAKTAERILNGAKPADLPIKKAAVFATLINKKSALASGITIPAEVLSKAARVIE
ncbi:MAG: ABC transporter substrate-binding protein [Candidatus Omnitrophica bacterium]|nr:ABC transporter substrate-binding protein [Candidatus Omnitrophota bacterium]